MKRIGRMQNLVGRCNRLITGLFAKVYVSVYHGIAQMRQKLVSTKSTGTERGDVPGWVLVVLMTTGLVTAIWMIAAPRLTAILRNSLDSMNGIR